MIDEQKVNAAAQARLERRIGSREVYIAQLEAELEATRAELDALQRRRNGHEVDDQVRVGN